MRSPYGAVAVHLGTLGLENVGPGWFTSIMGTGILAICIVISPVAVPFGHALAGALWLTATTLLAVFLALWIANGVRYPARVVATLSDPATAQLWGAPPMACFTIAVGFLKIGVMFVSGAACVEIAQALWIAGAAGALFSAFVVPYLMFTQHELTPEKTAGSWLLPIVPPIVASVPAALLATSWPPALRTDMLAFAYALLGVGVILAAIVIVLFYSRLVYQKVPASPLIPTMWIVVGPLGQSIAGIIALGTAARTVWPALAGGLATAALAYGVFVWGFAMYWLAMALAVTLRAVLKQLPFTLGWWAFTFPVGVLISGTDALFTVTHARIFAGSSVLLLALLATTWFIVATRTLGGALNVGEARVLAARTT